MGLRAVAARAGAWYHGRVPPAHHHAPSARPRRTAALALALALAPWAGADGWRLPAPPPPPEPEPALMAALHAAADRARAAAGLAATAWDDGLADAARAHAVELAARGVLDHAGATPETRTLAHRLARAGVPYTTVGENLAFETGSVEPVTVVVQGWLASPPHRANLLDAGFDRVGFGSARDATGGRYVVQVLAGVPWSPWAAAAEVVPVAVRRLALDVASVEARAVDGLLELDGAAERVTWQAGTTRLERVLVRPGGATGPTRVRLAVVTGDAAYAVDETGSAAPGSGWLADPSAPRRTVRVASARVEDGVAARVRVRAEVEPSVAAALLVDGHHRPDAVVRDGVLEVWLDLDDGTHASLALAEADGRGGLVVRHAFSVVRAGDRATLEARR